MSEPADWTLLAKYLSNECSDNEKLEIEKWIDADNENRKLINLMKMSWDMEEIIPEGREVKQIWNELSEKMDIADLAEADNHHWNNHLSANNSAKKTRNAMFKYPVLRVAAIIIILISFALFYSNRNDWHGKTDLITISVNHGDMERVELTDGTIVQLDAGSRLSYSPLFNKNRREVILRGEGFFEVSPDINKPFIIKANHSIIKVLGTKFNVRCWHSDKKVTVAVAEGKVAFHPGNNEKKSVVITRGKLSVLSEGGEPTPPEAVDVQKYLSWMQKEIFFENAPLSEILFQLERWYDVKFETINHSILSDRLDLHIKNQPLDEILDLISVLTNSEIEQSGQMIYLKTNTD